MRHVAAASLQRRLPVVVSGHDSVPVMKGRWPVVRVVGVVQVLGVVLVLRLPVGDTLGVVVWSVVLRISAVVQAALRMAVGVSKWPRARDRTSRLLNCSWVGRCPYRWCLCEWQLWCRRRCGWPWGCQCVTRLGRYRYRFWSFWYWFWEWFCVCRRPELSTSSCGVAAIAPTRSHNV